MKGEIQTADKLKEKIERLSTSVNQHNAELELVQRELKNTAKELKIQKKIILEATLIAEEAVYKKKGAEDALQCVNDDIQDATEDLVSMDNILDGKRKEAQEVDSMCEVLVLRAEQEKARIEKQTQKLREGIEKSCDKVKASL